MIRLLRVQSKLKWTLKLESHVYCLIAYVKIVELVLLDRNVFWLLVIIGHLHHRSEELFKVFFNTFHINSLSKLKTSPADQICSVDLNKLKLFGSFILKAIGRNDRTSAFSPRNNTSLAISCSISILTLLNSITCRI